MKSAIEVHCKEMKGQLMRSVLGNEKMNRTIIAVHCQGMKSAIEVHCQGWAVDAIKSKNVFEFEKQCRKGMKNGEEKAPGWFQSVCRRLAWHPVVTSQVMARVPKWCQVQEKVFRA
jgi:hypothetical protein